MFVDGAEVTLPTLGKENVKQRHRLLTEEVSESALVCIDPSTNYRLEIHTRLH